MKYIRTKTFITDLANWMEVDGKTLIIGGAKHEIIAQADNLEELCDDFVLVAPYRFKRPKTAGELDKDFEEMRYFYTDKDDTIYGSIWVGATLKAVAKWNQVKEEWELL